MTTIQAIVVIKLCLLLQWKNAFATYTRVGNTYMKTPESCCSLVPGDPALKCGLTALQATERVQIAYSPGFPNRFPIGRMCMWAIYSQSGYQVRLEFRDFYLIGPDKNGQCSDQYVYVESPLTGHSMGRFCGNSGIPTIVSAGNLLVVKLFSEIPLSSENFRGFAFVFRETLEAPNPELRPENWINHGQFSISDRAIGNELIKLKPTNVKTSKAKKVMEVATASSNQTANKGSSTKSTKITKKMVSRKKIPRFALPVSNNKNDHNIYGEYRNKNVKVTNEIQEPKDFPISIEAMVGIGAGAVCGTALLIFIICKLSQVHERKKNAKQTNERESSINKPNDDNACEQKKTEDDQCRQRSLHPQINNPTMLPGLTNQNFIPPTSTSSMPPDYFAAITEYPSYNTYNPLCQSCFSNGYGHFPTNQSNTLPAGFYSPNINQVHPQNSRLNGKILLFDTMSGTFLDPTVVEQRLSEHNPNCFQPKQNDRKESSSSESTYFSSSDSEEERKRVQRKKRKRRQTTCTKKESNR